MKEKLKILYMLFYFIFSMFAGSWFISDIFNMNTIENYDNFWNLIEIDTWLPLIMFLAFFKIVDSFKKSKSS